MYFFNKQKKKTGHENESNELQSVFVTPSNKLQSFVTQTIPGSPKCLMAKSQDENTPLTKRSPFK